MNAVQAAPGSQPGSQPARFRRSLLLGMLLLVSGLTALGLLLAQRKVSSEAQLSLEQEFQNEVAALHGAQELRLAALAERCRALVRRPRIHAALEDNALDLLYLSARDELRDVMTEGEEPGADLLPHALRARFYRFLGAGGRVISPPPMENVGALSPAEEAQLSLPRLPEMLQVGYLPRAGEEVDEVIAMPIVSTENGEVIAALVLGFKPAALPGAGQARRGICLAGQVHLKDLAPETEALIGTAVTRAAESRGDNRFEVEIDGAPHLLFFQELNADSLFARAYEVVVYPLAEARARQRRLRGQVLAVGVALLLGAVLGSHLLAGRLARPIEKLAVDSAENRAQRVRAEAALEMTSVELQRAARFSADASHQLKTPVAVLRAGLEELLAVHPLNSEAREEVAALVHQTFRLTNMVEDLLLLSRMDAGRLRLQMSPVDLNQILAGLVDDLSAVPDGPQVEVDADCPPMLIQSEKRYLAIILQNLLENARKYNRPGGRIHLGCAEEGESAVLTVGNTGGGIPAAAREHIFERFHRGAAGENVPGHGLGLNLARELARLHGGELRLSRSEDDWTEFEVRFRLAV